MSSRTVRRVSLQDIELVQNLIERCLQLYMTQKEVVETLVNRANIEPLFTELVWEKLERENHEFFKAYYIRLMVKHQIMEFNKLLEQQVHHMRQMHPTGVTTTQNTNVSHIQSMNQKESCYASEHADQSLKSGSAHHPMDSYLSNLLLNGSSTLNTNVPSSVNISTNARRVDASPNMLSSQTTNMPSSLNISTHARRVDASPNMLSSQTTNMPMMEGMNGGLDGGMIKSESIFANPASYMYGGERNAHEGHPAVGNTLMPNFSTDQLLSADSSTFGFLGQIPRNFSLSNLTASFPQSSDFLQSYDRSPFMVPSAENFLDSGERGVYQGDIGHHI